MKRIGFFSDNNGNLSSVRLFSFLSLLFSFLLASYATYANAIPVSFPLILSYLTAAFAPKVVQKFAEESFRRKKEQSED